MSGTWYLQRGRGAPIGPFTTEEVVDGLRNEEIPRDSLVREIAGTNWVPLAAIPEFRAFATVDGASDPDRLAPVEGPAWRSQADRHRRASSAPGDAPAPVATMRASKTSEPRDETVTRAFVPTPALHAVIGLAVGALGVTWGVMRLLSLVMSLAGWREVADSFHDLRPIAIVDYALAVAAYPALTVAVASSGRRTPWGRPLVRTIAKLLVIGNGAIVGATLFSLTRSPRWPLVGSKVTIVSMAIGAPIVLGACALALLSLFPEDRGQERTFGSSSTVQAGILLMIAGGVFAAFFTVTIDRLVLGARSDDGVIVYSDLQGLRLFLEARREGVAGLGKLQESERRGELVAPGTLARFVDEVSLPTAHGDEIAREVELLEGPSAGKHVFVPPESAKPAPVE